MQDDLIVLAQCIGHAKGGVPRKALIAVRTVQRKGNAVLLLIHGFYVPFPVVVAVRAAMQIVVVVIDAQLIGLSIDHKTSVGNPVAAASDDGSKIAGVVDVLLRCIVTEYDILYASVLCRNQQLYQGSLQGRSAPSSCCFCL